MSKNIPEYIPTLWENGDIITKDKLLNLEQGVKLNNNVLDMVIADSRGSFEGIRTDLARFNNELSQKNQPLLPVQIKVGKNPDTVLAYDIMNVQNAKAKAIEYFSQRNEDDIPNYTNFDDLRADLVDELNFAPSLAFLREDDNPPSLSDRFSAIFKMNNFGCLEQVSEEELSGKLMEDFDSTELTELYVVKFVTSSYYEDNVPFKIALSGYGSPSDAILNWRIYVAKTNITINGNTYNWGLFPIELYNEREDLYAAYIYVPSNGDLGDFFEAVSLASPIL